jgi:hypothetical protein
MALNPQKWTKHMKVCRFPSGAGGSKLLFPFALGSLILQLAAPCVFAGNQVLAWGQNNAGQIEVPQGLTDISAISGGASHSVALRNNGTVECWGHNLFGQSTPPDGLSNVAAIAAGGVHTLALKNDGTVVIWGNHSKPPTGLGMVKAIAAGYGHSLALTEAGEVVSWGSQTEVPANLGSIVAIGAGNGFSVGLRSDGTLVAWGDASYGKTEVPAGLSNVVAIAVGADHCLALQSSGTVVGWGGDYAGQASVPEGLANVVAISAGAAHSLALRADGTAAAWGDNTYKQTVINPALNRFAAVAAGGYHSLAIWGDGSPAILVQPRSQTVPIGSDPSFFVLVAGNQPLTFQWLRYGTNLPGKTAATLTLSNVQESNNGNYSVRVRNPLGTVFSAEATLAVLPIAPVITTQPLDQTTTCGDGTAAFQVIAQGKPLTYQWYFLNSPNPEIPGATKSSYNLSNVTTTNAGKYFAIISNPYGATTSAVATLTVLIAPPSITSPLSVSSKQGSFLSYQVTGVHNPTSFSAKDLPPGLTLDPATGLISGFFLLSGTFYTTVTAHNACTNDSAVIVFDVVNSVPTITSALTANGIEGMPFSYQITASNVGDTNWPTLFRANPLPMGLTLNPNSGLIAGVPVLPGTYRTSISASNAFGMGSAVVVITIQNAQITGLSLDNILTNYSSPYLLDFQFSLRDNNEPKLGNSVVVEPRLLSVECFEDDVAISSNETAVVIARGNSKVLKAFLVLDFTESMASLSNGDTNSDGISDAIDTLVGSAQTFVNQMPANAMVGVYEFHREDYAPSNVVALTTDKVKLNNSIAGIWTNYVKWFPAGSRCWDAVAAAVKDLGAAHPDEQHYVILVSDGVDESSTAVLTNVINTASNNNVHVYAIGFGDQLPIGINNLTNLAGGTGGHYYTATSTTGLASEFGQIIKDLNGQYILRWATLKRTATPFLPSFKISYQGLSATSPPPVVFTNFNKPDIDTNATPPTTNYPIETNFVVGPYNPANYTGDVTIGALRLLPNAEVLPTGITLRTAYSPRHIRQIRLKYRANWPCAVTMASTNLGDILYGWTMAQTNDVDGSTWLTLNPPNPQSPASELLFGAFGNLLDFTFRDSFSIKEAFSILQVDNTIYTNTGKQSWAFATTNLNPYITTYPPLPYGTPPPWLLQYGLGGNYTNREVADDDGDGALNWEEYRANTVPTNAASRFAILSFTEAYNGLNLVTFIGGSNRVFRLEVSNDLLNWWTAADNIKGSSGPISIPDPNYWTETNVFYRALVY